MKRKLGALDRVRITVGARKLFARERVDNRTRSEAVFLYFGGLSFRKVAIYFGTFTAEAVRYWWNRMSILFDYVGGPHQVVVADETRIPFGEKSLGEAHILWVALDAETLQVVNLKFARYQYNLDCRDFLSETWHKSLPNRPIIIHDLGPWYAIQAEKLGLPHHHVRGGVRSLIEMWNRHLKHRMDRFWRAFPANARPEQISRWTRSYTAIWNLSRGW